MKKEQTASISLIKIICISLILLFLSGIGVMAVNTNLKDVKITLRNGYEMTILTSKTKVKDILEDNNIILKEDEKVTPNLDEEIVEGTSIKITDKSYNEVQIAKISEEGVQTSLDDLLKNYAPITEKIVVEQVNIPFETITKNTTNTDQETTNKVIQEGKDGIKEITYKIKYQNEVELERTVLEEKVIKEPVNKIVQVNKVVKTTSRSSTSPRTNTATAQTNNNSNSSRSQIYKVTAYCPCSKCCGKYASGYTAAGTKATAGRTVAASSKFAFGTKLNINGKVYTVEDRGGAIKGNRIDIFVSSHAEALKWGVKYLPVSVAN